MEDSKKSSALNIFRKPLFAYTIKRILSSCVTILLVIIAVFLLLRVTPKERYLDMAVVSKIPVAQREAYIQSVYAEYGLDKPIHIQLVDYLIDVLPIPSEKCAKTSYDDNYNVICTEYETEIVDFGNSAIYKKGKPVLQLAKDTFPVSFKITMIATFFAYLIGYPLGVLMARFKDKWVDKLGNVYVILTMAVPALVFYYIWFIISMKVFHFPSSFNQADIRTWITPIWAITFLSAATQALWVRRYMVDELNSDYVKFARAKGLSENKIMFKHVFRNALVPLVRNIPAAIIFSIVGSYFVEQLWAIPGSGRLLMTSILMKDNPLVQGLVIIYAAISMLAFLIGDIVTVFCDPRISLEKTK